MDIVPSSQLFISGSGKKDDSGIRNGAFGVSEVPCGGEDLASGQSPCTHRVMFHINVGCYGEPGPITIMSLIDL